MRGGNSVSQEAVEAADLLEAIPVRLLRPLLASLSPETRLELLGALRAAQRPEKPLWISRPDRAVRA